MIVTKEETLSLQAIFVNLQMTLNKEETINTIFVKRADILNCIGIETGYHWKK